MAKVAFGTYRINEYNQTHIDALTKALRSGIALIETSTNYTNGSAERAIAKALKHFDTSILERVEIVGKCGYIQGELLEEFKKKEPSEEVVCYKENCYHSIAPWFIKQQLQNSLENLGVDKLDCYMLHDPQYYIYDAVNKNIDKKLYEKEMQNRIFEAFVALEELVSEGKILSYGISSQSFSLPKEDELFLEYENLPALAKEASLCVGNTKDSFTTIELPVNIIEKYGLNCSFWAKEQNLRVLSSRTLSGIYNDQPYRLAEYDEPRDYYMYLNELLEFCDNELLLPIYNLINGLDETIHKFNYIGEYDSFVHSNILPHVKNTLLKVDGDTQEKMIHYIELFLENYRQMVLHVSGKKTRDILKIYFKNCTATMQECALNYMLQQESVDFALVGARKMSYVEQILETS